jgi:PAS domain S-box-containing protein
MSENQIEILKRKLAKEKAARKAAEKKLKQKTTELVDANQKLLEAKEEYEILLTNTDAQLQGVFENIIDAYVIMDLFGNILKLNDSALELFGFENSNEDFNLMKLVDPNETHRVKESFNTLMTTGHITDFQVKIITRKKKHILVHINASLIYDDDIAVAAQGIVRDITKERDYHNRIEAEKLKYESIISNMNLGLVEVDKEDSILMVNKTFESMTGYTKEELIGLKGKDFLPVSNQDIINNHVEERKKGNTKSQEIQIRKKDGEIRHWLISGAPNYDSNGNVTGAIGINLDISDIKQLEIQKEKLLADLERSNNELNQYAHIVTHDLKSPLRSLNALVSWIKDDNKDKLNDTSIQYIELIENTIEKMDQLITDILEYSSIDASGQVNELVNLDEVINELLLIIFKPDHISIEILNTLPVIKGNQAKLKQLFQNLICNAIKFIDKENGIIKIDVKEYSTHYEFSIEDNGIGIELEHHDRIFKEFQSLNKSKDSTGIGLSIVKKIINLHQGEIWLKSIPNVGTTFFFTLKK